MLDIGWSELLVIAVIMIVVVGPKDLPQMLRAFGKMTSRLRHTAGEFRAQFDEALREAELEDVSKTISDVRKFNPRSMVRDAVSPLLQAGDEIRSEMTRATSVPDPLKPEMADPLPPPLTKELVEQPSIMPPPAPAAVTDPAVAQVPAKRKRTAAKTAEAVEMPAPVAARQSRATAPAKTAATRKSASVSAKTAAKSAAGAVKSAGKPKSIAKPKPARAVQTVATGLDPVTVTPVDPAAAPATKAKTTTASRAKKTAAAEKDQA